MERMNGWKRMRIPNHPSHPFHPFTRRCRRADKGIYHSRRASRRTMPDAAGPESVPVRSETPSLTVERLARALSLPAERVDAAMRAAGVTPGEAFEAILHGSGAERVDRLAKELKVTRPRLALALLDGAVATTSQ